MRNLIFISFLFLLFSCKSNSQKKTTTAQSEQEPEWFSIELAETLSDATNEQKPYSTFVKEIEYIPLETNSKSFVGDAKHWLRIHAVTKKVIIVDMKIFSRKDGRYIGNLLSRGKATNEYLYPNFVVADDEREEFYIVEDDKKIMHIVGYDNSYKGKMDWKMGYNTQCFALGNGNLLVGREQRLEYGYDDFQIINIDTKEVLGKRLSSALTNIENLEDCKHIVKYHNSDRYAAIGDNVFWRYKDNIRYYDYLTDSLFTIDTNMKVGPIGTLDFEKLKKTKEQVQLPFSKQFFLWWSIHRIVETSDEIIISVFSWRKPRGGASYLLTYSKANKTTKIITQGDPPQGMPSPSLYLNDFDNGISFYPWHTTLNESAYYNFLTPLQIKDLVAEKRDSAYTTEREKAFKAMADTLKDDDNEVVAILHVDW